MAPDAAEDVRAGHDEHVGKVEGEAAVVSWSEEIGGEIGGEDGDFARDEEAIEIEWGGGGEEAGEGGRDEDGRVVDAQERVVDGDALVFEGDDVAERERGVGDGGSKRDEVARTEGRGVDDGADGDGECVWGKPGSRGLADADGRAEEEGEGEREGVGGEERGGPRGGGALTAEKGEVRAEREAEGERAGG